MERFNLETWLKDKSRKVIDDNGFPVEIIHWNAHVKYPVVYLDHNGVAVNVTTDGMYDSDPNHGLFFADEELTEFDYAILSIISDHNSHTDSIEAFAKRSSKKLLDLARKELESERDRTCEEAALSQVYGEGYEQGNQDALKDLPKWKKITKREQNYLVYGYLSNDEYYLSIQELKDKLPKEE